MTGRQIIIIAAALLGAAGVALAAASAHAPSGQSAATAANLLIMHATAAIAVVATSNLTDRRALFRLSATLMLAGAALFAGDIALRTFGNGARLFPSAAPIGGMTMIAGWLTLAIAALIHWPRND